MGTLTDTAQRKRLEELSANLRAAACAALEHRSALARSLDECRGELERLLMLGAIDVMEYRRAVIRGQMMLDAWHGMAAESFSRPR